MNQLQEIYNTFITAFPAAWQPYIAFAAGVCLVVAIIQAIRKEFIWIVVLIVLLPASIPILKGTALTLLAFIKFLFGVHDSV